MSVRGRTVTGASSSYSDYHEPVASKQPRSLPRAPSPVSKPLNGTSEATSKYTSSAELSLHAILAACNPPCPTQRAPKGYVWQMTSADTGIWVYRGRPAENDDEWDINDSGISTSSSSSYSHSYASTSRSGSSLSLQTLSDLGESVLETVVGATDRMAASLPSVAVDLSEVPQMIKASLPRLSLLPRRSPSTPTRAQFLRGRSTQWRTLDDALEYLESALDAEHAAHMQEKARLAALDAQRERRQAQLARPLCSLARWYTPAEVPRISPFLADELAHEARMKRQWVAHQREIVLRQSGLWTWWQHNRANQVDEDDEEESESERIRKLNRRDIH